MNVKQFVAVAKAKKITNSQKCEKRIMDFDIDAYAEEIFNLVRLGENTSYKHIIHVYERMINNYTPASGFNAICGLTKVVLSRIDKKSPCFSYAFIAKRNILAALYILTVKYDFDYFKLFSQIHDVKCFFNARCFTIRWSFNHFALIFDAVKYYGYSIYNAQDTLKLLWGEFFNEFLNNASEQDIKMLRESDDTWDNMQDIKWRDYLNICFKISYNQLVNPYTRGKELPITESESEVYKKAGCIAVSDTIFVVSIYKYYPEFLDNVCAIVLMTKIAYIVCDCNMSDEDDINAYVKDLTNFMQRIADYKVYRSEEISIKPLWKEVIMAIMKNLTGVALNIAVDILAESFYVSRDEMVDFIKMKTIEILNDERDKLTGFTRLAMLLSNPVVFEVVAQNKNSIIQVFND